MDENKEMKRDNKRSFLDYFNSSPNDQSELECKSLSTADTGNKGSHSAELVCVVESVCTVPYFKY